MKKILKTIAIVLISMIVFHAVKDYLGTIVKVKDQIDFFTDYGFFGGMVYFALLLKIEDAEFR